MPEHTKTRTKEEQQRRMRIVSDAIENYVYTNLRDAETPADQERREILLETLAEMASVVYAPIAPVSQEEVSDSSKKKTGGKKE
jgi:hypothetical protein